MMSTLDSVLASREAALAIEPEELAVLLLRHLLAVGTDSRIIPSNLANARLHHGPEVCRAVMEAWAWLENNGCVARDPAVLGATSYFISRNGRALASSQDGVDATRVSSLPRGMLHKSIRERVWSAFLRAAYDTAVFEAFRQVEIEVRLAAGLTQEDFGVPLMRKAFRPEGGPLTDMSQQDGERRALADLFAGAIGSYKNPHSHRNVTVGGPEEASEMVLLASHLLRIVDVRRSKPQDSLEALGPRPSTA
ncbi:MAG: TIGR02391 family protein [Phycisphaerales bacterium]